MKNGRLSWWVCAYSLYLYLSACLWLCCYGSIYPDRDGVALGPADATGDGDPWNETYDDRCPKLYPRNFLGYAPRGNISAGNYTEKEQAKGLKRCVLECCSSETCNVVFMHDSTCYHIQCASDDLCLPLLRSESPRLSTHVTMVLVNPLSDGTWQEVLDNANERYNDEPSITASLEEEILNDLASAESRNDLLSANPYRYFNDGRDVIVPSHFSENINPQSNFLENHFFDKNDRLVMEASEDFTEKLISCEIGIGVACPPNEECVSQLSKSRSGMCQCVEGYRRNATGVCDKEAVSPPNAFDKDIPNKLKKDDNVMIQTPDTSSELNTKKLTVSAVSKEVRLPENEVTLSVYTIPDEKTSNDHYIYLWKLVEQPKSGFTGIMKGQNGGTVSLSQLTEGFYRFKVTVTGTVTNSYGEAYANVTVLPANRMNKPPMVIITPSSQIVKLPNTGAVLDGSDSKDDDAIISWRWELTSGPLGYQPPLYDGPTLQLKDLKLPGNYTFRLTVEDSDHVKNSTTANITVLNHTDYPPEANAGQDIIIHLPTNKVTLNGSLSTDDHEIKIWEWTKSSQDQDKAVDMQNTHSPYLQLSNLSEGVYTFVLKVTDSSGQSSTADVRVFVKPPTNTPPTAKAGKPQYISLPLTWVILNGSESSDDHRIVAYNWKVIKGPTNATLTNFNESITNLTGLTKGEYRVQLTVLDDNGNSASDVVDITVTQNKNAAPKANGGGDQFLVMPVTVVSLNGSMSTDDLKIIKWQWTRQPTSMAAGKIVGNTDSEPVLLLTDVSPGRYIFSLTVLDDQGLSDIDTVTVNIKPNPNLKNLVKLTLNIPATVLTFGQITSLQQKLSLLMGETYNINITDIKANEMTTEAEVVFYVTDKKSPPEALMGSEVVSQLKTKLRKDAGLLELNVAHIDTIICQNNCSGHGVCYEATRQCLCEAFWMQNIFTSFIDDMDPNCDWSILYVVVIGLVICLLFIGVVWGICCLLQRICIQKSTSRRRVARYTLLGGADEEETTHFTPSKMSISDSDTDSDILFESRNKNSRNGDVHKNGKGGARNGFAKAGRRIKT